MHSVAKITKNSKGDRLISAGFVGYVKKVNNERDLLETKKFSKKCRTMPKKIEGGGTLCTEFALGPWPDLAPEVVSGLFLKSGPISVRIVV